MGADGSCPFQGAVGLLQFSLFLLLVSFCFKDKPIIYLKGQVNWDFSALYFTLTQAEGRRDYFGLEAVEGLSAAPGRLTLWDQNLPAPGFILKASQSERTEDSALPTPGKQSRGRALIGWLGPV